MSTHIADHHAKSMGFWIADWLPTALQPLADSISQEGHKLLVERRSQAGTGRSETGTIDKLYIDAANSDMWIQSPNPLHTFTIIAKGGWVLLRLLIWLSRTLAVATLSLMFPLFSGFHQFLRLLFQFLARYRCRWEHHAYRELSLPRPG